MSRRRILLIALVVCTFLGILISGHIYLARRLIFDAGITQPLAGVLVALVVCLALTLPLEPILQRRAPQRYARPAAWLAWTWLGLWFLAVVCLLASELVVLLFPVSDAARAIAVAGLAVFSAIAGVVSVLRGPRLVRVEISPARWPRQLDGFRIVQLSDLHIGPILRRSFVKSVVERVNALEADLVAITGDLADGDARQLVSEVQPLADLRAAQGTFFVTGNHDYFSGVSDWVEAMRGLGLRLLRNERVVIKTQQAEFELAGVDDYRGDWGRSNYDLAEALRDRDPSRSLILLAHDPTTFKQAAATGVDLQLSGHTHGGQIWPFRYAVRIAVPFVAGLYRRGEAQIYVSRGTGFWGPPMRLFAPAEITEITLRAP
jgi:predicted MPP superfamily phosphohydrolase